MTTRKTDKDGFVVHKKADDVLLFAADNRFRMEINHFVFHTGFTEAYLSRTMPNDRVGPTQYIGDTSFNGCVLAQLVYQFFIDGIDDVERWPKHCVPRAQLNVDRLRTLHAALYALCMGIAANAASREVDLTRDRFISRLYAYTREWGGHEDPIQNVAVTWKRGVGHPRIIVCIDTNAMLGLLHEPEPDDVNRSYSRWLTRMYAEHERRFDVERSYEASPVPTAELITDDRAMPTEVHGGTLSFVAFNEERFELHCSYAYCEGVMSRRPGPPVILSTAIRYLLPRLGFSEENSLSIFAFDEYIQHSYDPTDSRNFETYFRLAEQHNVPLNVLVDSVAIGRNVRDQEHVLRIQTRTCRFPIPGSRLAATTPIWTHPMVESPRTQTATTQVVVVKRRLTFRKRGDE